MENTIRAKNHDPACKISNEIITHEDLIALKNLQEIARQYSFEVITRSFNLQLSIVRLRGYSVYTPPENQLNQPGV